METTYELRFKAAGYWVSPYRAGDRFSEIHVTFSREDQALRELGYARKRYTDYQWKLVQVQEQDVVEPADKHLELAAKLAAMVVGGATQAERANAARRLDALIIKYGIEDTYIIRTRNAAVQAGLI